MSAAALIGVQASLLAAVAEEGATRLERQTVTLTKGASLPISATEVFANLAVSEPSIADASPVSTTEYYVRGREVGSTNILLYSDNGRLIQIV
ncbi:MAG: hypothetical protein GYB42_10635, partial [Alphaproteobacteria bacterium]|nr:hypothetical protein [Alphaproteobacteria bacterium]